MKQNQFEFKPLDQVLVRDTDQGIWKVTLFSHYDDTCENYKHVTVSGQYAQCIPYNENTAYLLGTNAPHESKKYHVWTPTGGLDTRFTEKELIDFIEKTVIKNKDITELCIRYLK